MWYTARGLDSAIQVNPSVKRFVRIETLAVCAVVEAVFRCRCYEVLVSTLARHSAKGLIEWRLMSSKTREWFSYGVELAWASWSLRELQTKSCQRKTGNVPHWNACTEILFCHSSQSKCQAVCENRNSGSLCCGSCVQMQMLWSSR